MKKIKIVGICSVLSILLTACGGDGTSNATSEKPGFSYEHPDTSITEDFVVNIDYSGNTILKDLINSFSSLNKNNCLEVLQKLDANPLLPAKGKVNIYDFVNYDLNQDNNLENDIGNLEINQEFDFTRDNNDHSKSGTLKYVSKVIEDQAGVAHKTTKSILDGVYSLTVDPINYKINESYDFKDETLNKTNSYFLNDSNLHKYMQVINLEKFKQKTVDSVSNWIKNPTPNSTIEGVKSETELKIQAENIIKLENVRDTEKYEVIFDVSGYVKSATWSYIRDVATSTPDTYDLITEKHTVNYTFSL